MYDDPKKLSHEELSDALDRMPRTPVDFGCTPIQAAGITREAARRLRAATQGHCTCNCGKEVLNAWRDSDGYHCLTCLAKERDKANALLRQVSGALESNVRTERRAAWDAITKHFD
jgi:hypothetical protein